MLDIDHFRDINAAFGAGAGDETIKAAAAAFAPLVGEGEVAARLSGDEFAFFLPGAGPERGLTLAESVRAAAERLCVQFPDPNGGPPERPVVTVSIGVAAAPDDASTPEDLTAVADKALYAAKESGRNRVVRVPPPGTPTRKGE